MEVGTGEGSGGSDIWTVVEMASETSPVFITGSCLGAGFESGVLVSISSLVDCDVTFILEAMGAGASGRTECELRSSFMRADVSEFCPSPATSGVVTESLRGRPLLRFGEGGRFSSSIGEVGMGLIVSSDSSNLGGVFGGRPLFLFNGVAVELKGDSVELKAVSFPGMGSVFLDWFGPRPRPTCCCCSPS